MSVTNSSTVTVLCKLESSLSTFFHSRLWARGRCTLDSTYRTNIHSHSHCHLTPHKKAPVLQVDWSLEPSSCYIKYLNFSFKLPLLDYRMRVQKRRHSERDSFEREANSSERGRTSGTLQWISGTVSLFSSSAVRIIILQRLSFENPFPYDLLIFWTNVTDNAWHAFLKYPQNRLDKGGILS